MSAHYEWLKAKAKKYGIWLMIPLLSIYSLDFVVLVIEVARALIVSFLVLFICSFGAGLVMRIIQHKFCSTILMKSRLVAILPSLKWGHDFIDWVLGDIEG